MWVVEGSRTGVGGMGETARRSANEGPGQGAAQRPRAAEVTARIRRDIITGELASGTRLAETLLAERYAVSRMPIRESLRALAGEGLVEIRPYAGATVAALPDDDAADLFAIRIELEAATARRAAERVQRHLAGTTPEESWHRTRGALTEVLTSGSAALEAGEPERLAELNMRFHQGIAALSGSASLMALLEQISGRIEWLYSMNVTRRGGEAWSEHHEIISAVDSGDALGAAERMRAHVARSRDAYFTHISSTG